VDSFGYGKIMFRFLHGKHWWCSPNKGNGKGKGKGSSTCYSAFYMSQTRNPKRFTISEVAADWHELMIPQRTVQPSIARISEQLDRGLQLADIPPPQSVILG